MSIAFVADVHLGNFAKDGGALVGGINVRARRVIDALDWAVNASLECEAFVVLGDLFHYCHPEPALIAAVQDVLAQHPKVILIGGNHDMSSTTIGDNALAPLRPVARVCEQAAVIQCDLSGVQLWVVPFRPGPAKDWLPDALAELERDAAMLPTRVLCLHLGISDEGTPYYLDSTRGSMSARALAELCSRHLISNVFAGDWHRHQRWDIGSACIMQVGTLCPARFSPGYEHGDRGPLAMLRDDGALDVFDVPGPRFYKRQWSGGVNDWPPIGEAPGCARYLKLNCSQQASADARAWAEEHGESFESATLEIDHGLDRAKARTASFEARQGSSLDHALELYVERMPLPSPACDRKRVLQYARKYIGEAG